MQEQLVYFSLAVHQWHVSLILIVILAVSACGPPRPAEPVPILLFTGSGSSAGDVAAVEQVLDDNQLVHAY